MWLLALFSLPLHLQNANIVLGKIKAKLFNYLLIFGCVRREDAKIWDVHDAQGPIVSLEGNRNIYAQWQM